MKGLLSWMLHVIRRISSESSAGFCLHVHTYVRDYDYGGKESKKKSIDWVWEAAASQLVSTRLPLRVRAAGMVGLYVGPSPAHQDRHGEGYVVPPLLTLHLTFDKLFLKKNY